MQSGISVIWIYKLRHCRKELIIYIYSKRSGAQAPGTNTNRVEPNDPIDHLRPIRPPKSKSLTTLFLGLPRSLSLYSHRSGFLCLVLSCPDLLLLCFFFVVFLRSSSFFDLPPSSCFSATKISLVPFLLFLSSSPVQLIPASQPASLFAPAPEALELLLRTGKENIVHFILSHFIHFPPLELLLYTLSASRQKTFLDIVSRNLSVFAR